MKQQHRVMLWIAAQSCDKSEAYITHFHQNYCFHFGAITVEAIEIAPTFIL